MAKLEFDHLEPREWSSKTEWSHRISIIRREIVAGLIQLLCGDCNKRKGKPIPRAEPASELQEELQL